MAIKRFWAAMLSLAMILVVAVGSPSAFAQTSAIQVPGVFRGYTDNEIAVEAPYGDGTNQTAHPAPLVVRPDGALESAAEVAYCFNMGRTIPSYGDANPDGTNLQYTKFYSGLLGFADTPRAGADQGVLDVMYNGFPNDAAGLQTALGLTDNEFRYATQLAIWYWTDSANGDYLYDATENMSGIEQAYKMLTRQIPAPVTLPAVDAQKATLEIYEESTGRADMNYQSLVTAKFVNPQDGTPVENPGVPTESTTPTPVTEITTEPEVTTEITTVPDITTEPVATTTSTAPAETTTVVETPTVTETTTITHTDVSETQVTTTSTTTLEPSVVTTTEVEPEVTTTVTEAGTTVTQTSIEPDTTTTVTEPGKNITTTETEPDTTTTVTEPGKNVTTTESEPDTTTTVTEPGKNITTTETEPDTTTTETEPGKNVTTTETEPDTTTTETEPGKNVTTTETEPDTTTTVTEPGKVVTTTETAPAVTTTVTEDPTVETVTETPEPTTVTTTVPAETETTTVPTLTTTVVPGETNDDNDDNGNDWWKVIVPIGLIGGGLALLGGNDAPAAPAPAPQPAREDAVLGISNTPVAGAPEKGVPANQAPANQAPANQAPANQAPAQAGKKMLASTGASVLGLSAVAALILALGVYFVAGRRKES